MLKSVIIGKKVLLRDKRLSDAWDDYTWESDSGLAHLDAAVPVTSTFSQYLADYTDALAFLLPTSQRFAIDTLDGKHIGNCSFYNINETEGEAELGIMIGNRNYWDRGYGTDTVKTLVDYIFRSTSLKRIYLKTLRTNSRAQICFAQCGFTMCGYLERGGFSFVQMELHRPQPNGLARGAKD